MPLFSYQPLTWQGELTCSPSNGQGMSHRARDPSWDHKDEGQQWHTDLCGKGLSCRVKSQGTRAVVLL